MSRRVELQRLKQATARGHAAARVAKKHPERFGCCVCGAPCVELEPEPRCERHRWGGGITPAKGGGR